MFGDHGLGSLLEEGGHGKSPKCLGGNLGDFGEFCKGLGLFCICVESNTVIQNQIFISYANNPGIPFPVVQFESLGSKTMVSVVPNPPVHVC